jgi:cytochrome c553
MARRYRAAAAWRRLLQVASLLIFGLFAVMLAHSRQTNELHDALQLTPNLEHGRSLYSTCAACHQSHGGGDPGGGIPSIAAQHYEVLVEQLANFREVARDATRWDPRMAAFTGQHHLEGPQDLADVAAYIAALPPRPGEAVGPGDRTSLGGRLYVRACQHCHGAQGEGNGSLRYPRLAGQHFAYLARQIRAMSAGRRPNASFDHAALLEDLPDAEMDAVADYLSRLKPAEATELTGQKAPTVEHVEVTARRAELRRVLYSFVSTITRADGANVARWRDPICPWVAGALPAQGDFIKSRVGQIASSVGARVDRDANCRANLLVFVTTEPNELVEQLRGRNPGVFSGASGPQIDEFAQAMRPVRVWQNTALQNADGSPPILYGGPPQYRLRDSRIVGSVSEEFAAVMVVVDTGTTGRATLDQLADYIAMVALAQVDMDAELGSSPTILRLFSKSSPGESPARLTSWDYAFLKALYGMDDSCLQSQSAIAVRMTPDLERGE